MTTINSAPIYVLKAGLRYGPYSSEELRQQLKEGFFTAENFASCDESKSWNPIAALPEMEPPAFVVELDQAENLLVIRYRGRVTAAAVAQCAERVRAGLTKIQPGFQLLVDLSELTSMEVASIPPLEEIMDLCNDKGVRAVVRVIPDPKRDIGLQILSYFHYAPGVRIVTCTSMDEAMRRLE